MAGSNAGKKRNRFAFGVPTVRSQFTLEANYGAAIERAAQESGDLAPSLYLQLLLEQLVDVGDDGQVALPLVNPNLRQSREARSAAA